MTSKTEIFSKFCHNKMFQDDISSGECVSVTSEFRTSAMLVLLAVGTASLDSEFIN